MSKNKFNPAMFDKLKDTLKKTEGGSGSFSNIMKFPAGHTYTIRLIPNLENIEDTFFHHYTHQWTSKATGKFTSALSLQTFGEKDPISAVRWKAYKAWKDTKPGKDDKFDGDIQQKEQWYANIYVVEDPSDAENNGTVKVLKMGTQLMNIIKDAMEGDRAEEFGASIFDLTKDGADFKIVAKQQGDYTTFITSFFTSKTKLDLSDEEIDTIYENIHDLKQIQPVKTYDELVTLLDEHYFCEESEDAPKEREERKALPKKTVDKPKTTKPAKTVKPAEGEVEDEIPMSFDSDVLDSEDGEDIDELLKGLND